MPPPPPLLRRLAGAPLVCAKAQGKMAAWRLSTLQAPLRRRTQFRPRRARKHYARSKRYVLHTTSSRRRALWLSRWLHLSLLAGYPLEKAHKNTARSSTQKHRLTQPAGELLPVLSLSLLAVPMRTSTLKRLESSVHSEREQKHRLQDKAPRPQERSYPVNSAHLLALHAAS